MKSVGETMAIGRNFKEALQKALRGLEIGVDGLDLKAEEKGFCDPELLEAELAKLEPNRLFRVKHALKQDISPKRIFEITSIDPWFIDNIQQIVEIEQELLTAPALDKTLLRKAKRNGLLRCPNRRSTWQACG